MSNSSWAYKSSNSIYAYKSYKVNNHRIRSNYGLDNPDTYLATRMAVYFKAGRISIPEHTSRNNFSSNVSFWIEEKLIELSDLYFMPWIHWDEIMLWLNILAPE